MAGCIFHQYYANGISFVWKVDGWNQHYKALYMYSNWLRSIARSLFIEHKLSVDLYSFALGYGSDIISTLHYYVIGDPICLFSAFFPGEKLAHFYTLSIYARLYLAGCAFSAYCFYMKKNNQTAVMAGVLLYCFPLLLPINLIKHPYFLNPYIYLPLLLIGVEKILRKESKLPFILAVFISAVSNFYFFYMLVLTVVLYVLIRLAGSWKEHGSAGTFAYLGTYLGCGITGVLMSCTILVPVIYLFLRGSRQSNSLKDGLALLYPGDYYRDLFANVFTKSIVLELSCIAFFCLLLLFIQRCNRQLMAGFLVLLLILLCPLGGKIMNGFSYVSDRWVFSMIFLLAYITTSMWDRLFECSLRETALIMIVFCLYYAWTVRQAVIIEDKISLAMFRYVTILSAVAMLCILIPKLVHGNMIRRLCSLACFGIIGLTSIARLHFAVDPAWVDISAQYAGYESIKKHMFAGIDKAILSVDNDKDGFYRYGAPYDETMRNSQVISGLKGMSYYWSLADRVVNDYMVEMGLPFAFDYKIRNLDDTTSLTDLASVKYYVIRSDKGRKRRVPFGFRKVKQLKEDTLKGDKTFSVYENDYFLPFGYTCDAVIHDQQYNAMSYIERQTALLQGVHIKDEDMVSGYPQAEIHQDYRRLKYHMTGSEGVEIKDNVYRVTGDKAQLTYEIEDAEADCSTELLIQGISFEPEAEETELFVKEHAYVKALCNEGHEKEIAVNVFIGTKNFYQYNGRKDFLINLGYNEKPKKTFSLVFPYKGTYRIKNLTLYNQPMVRYPKLLNRLREESLEDISFDDNTLTGKITVKKDKILCLPMTYSRGWKARVNGKAVSPVPANTMFMAIPLKRGVNTIRLDYCTPMLPLGIILSIAGLLISIGVYAYEKKRR